MPAIMSHFAIFVLLFLALPLKAEEPAQAPPGRVEPVSPYKREFLERVNRAIGAGTAWLRRTQDADATWPSRNARAYPLGTVALGALALVKGKVALDDPSLQGAFARLRGRSPTRTYEAAVVLMLLEARYVSAAPPQDSKDLPPIPAPPALASMHDADRALSSSAVRCLLDGQQLGGLWSYGVESGAADLSNTQYALLGLHAAVRCGHEVPRRSWLSAMTAVGRLQASTGPAVGLLVSTIGGSERHVRTVPARARGFTYQQAVPPATGSMTAAGVASLCLCRDSLRGSALLTESGSRRTETDIRDGLAWLQEEVRFDCNPYADGTAGTRSYRYYLYALERLGRLAGIRFIGDHDWYLQGALELLRQQERDASDNLLGWHNFEDTCFALLFLERASTTSLPVVTLER